jgi:hypothetical protein
VFERAVAAAATATELAAWTILETPFALLAHVVITVALGAHLWRVWAGNQLGFALPLTVATAVAGPIGAGSMLAAMLLTEFFRRSAKPAADWLDGLDEARGSGTRTNPSRDREGAVSAVEVTPLMDILEMGDELQKQEVVALVTRSFRPALAPLLKRALEDSSNAIRVQAATAMARIEGRFLHRAMQLDQLAAKKPGSSDVARDLAHLYDDYVCSIPCASARIYNLPGNGMKPGSRWSPTAQRRTSRSAACSFAARSGNRPTITSKRRAEMLRCGGWKLCSGSAATKKFRLWLPL